MSAIAAVPYDAGSAELWNRFNEAAANGHFLFDRRFMEYHADRFADASLLFVKDGVPVAILPANEADGRLHSHQGLTFGGVVHGDDIRLEDMLEMFDALIAHARGRGLGSIVYKAMPAIYHRASAEQALYALFRRDAQCRRRDVTATIDYRAPGRLSRRRRRSVSKSAASGLELGWDTAWGEYWPVLAEVLRRRHNRNPVHSPDEIGRLAENFGDNIRLFVARKDGAVIAGVVMFETPQVAHAQYVAASPYGQALCALDAVFDHLIGFYAGRKRYFDFGISTEDGGHTLNAGLADYKQEWGAGCVVQDTYELAV